MKCEKCGAELREGAKFCTKCGAKAGPAADAFCGECGAKLKPGDAFCPECGTPVPGSGEMKRRGRPPKARPETAEDSLSLESESPAEAAGLRNVSGFYYAPNRGCRVSQSYRAAVCCTAYELHRFDGSGTMLKHQPDPKNGEPYPKAVTQTPEGILTAGLLYDSDSRTSRYLLCRYDDGLQLLGKQEIGTYKGDVSEHFFLTPDYVYILLDHGEGEKLRIFKYDIAAGKGETKALPAKYRVDLDSSYADGEKLYLSLTERKTVRDEDGYEQTTDTTVFALLDTQVWGLTVLWNISAFSGSHIFNEWIFFPDFPQGLAWTSTTAEEQRKYGIPANALAARSLLNGAILPQREPWLLPTERYQQLNGRNYDADVLDLGVNFFYFNGNTAYFGNGRCGFYALDRDGTVSDDWDPIANPDRHPTAMEETVVWKENIYAKLDCSNCFYRYDDRFQSLYPGAGSEITVREV